ncbi:MAG: hypothetical protein NT169_21445 [Chloroflexi bacterium]|nr:hypothetical protein [Chloroflexota bacterium]
MRWHKTIALSLLLCLVLSACGAHNTPEAAVERLYKAVEAQDTDKYLDAIDPAMRSQPNLMGMFNGLSLSAGFGGFGVGLNLKSLSKTSFREMSYRMVDSRGDVAHVQAEGKMRMAALGMELSFCDIHLMRKIKGQWLVSYDQAEQEAKLARWQQRLNEQDATANPTNPWAGLETMLDFCQ